MQHCDAKCGWCARQHWAWLKARLAQMSVPRKKRNETVSFDACAATSIKPPVPFSECQMCTIGPAGTKVMFKGKFFTVEHNAGYVGLDGRHWIKIQGVHVTCDCLL